jgi:FtsH-binding integral membrane protein
VIGVLLFTGLTAYDTQRIKQVYFDLGRTGDLAKSALWER